MARVALLGGSFNPPHIAHQMVCLWALSTDQVDEVWLVPAFEHPFHKPLVAFSHRLAMASLALCPFAPERVRLCAIERELPAPSRTAQTVEHLAARYPQHRFSLLVGADIVREKESWYRFDVIERLAPPIVIGRDGYASPSGSLVLPDISSSAIRQALAQGRDPGAVLPAAVLRYIRQQGLYQTADS